MTNPLVRNTPKGIKRTMGTAAVQKAPALTADIRAMVETTDAGLIGSRDRAIVLLASQERFAARRSSVSTCRTSPSVGTV